MSADVYIQGNDSWILPATWFAADEVLGHGCSPFRFGVGRASRQSRAAPPRDAEHRFRSSFEARCRYSNSLLKLQGHA